nr:MAG TPA: hypothetical protein [Caudoviricetes sp.]
MHNSIRGASFFCPVNLWLLPVNLWSNLIRRHHSRLSAHISSWPYY